MGGFGMCLAFDIGIEAKQEIGGFRGMARSAEDGAVVLAQNRQ
ncbi:hypothetical protein [Mesorhizobium sp.]|nr:hypothetical protein [Mesorhizobium sp.]